MLSNHSILLDSARAESGESDGALLFEDPVEILTTTLYEDIPPLLENLSEYAASGFWCVGYLAYEAGYAFDPAGFPDPPHGDTLAWFGIYEKPKQIDTESWLDEIPQADYSIQSAKFSLDRETYRSRIERLKHHIREGDVYQINLTAPLRFAFDGNPLGLFADLRKKQRVPYGAVMQIDGRWILSLSPELFIRREANRIVSRPMKGTARRGHSYEEDQHVADWLAADEKNQAENVMIVDLIRNDLSRIAVPGSVDVPDLFVTERYETLWQMTSTVEAEVRSEVTFAEIIQSLFPCGSITGAPKRRAMQIIQSLEDQPRGVYCGAIGMIKPGGDFVFSVPIRTLEIESGRGRMGIGSGVVWDSDADSEYDECLLKSQFLTNPPQEDFDLIETMRAEEGHIPLIEHHLDRLAQSAHYFGYPFDEDALLKKLKDIGSGIRRVRVLLDKKGDFEVQSSPLSEMPPIERVLVYPEPIPSGVFFRHKTTQREFYDKALVWAREHGADEAILIDESGEIVEGCLSNVWIRDKGELLTPSLTTTGLQGVMRHEILETRCDALEVPLRLEDVLNAEEILLSNAVRGLWPVVLQNSPRALP